jgi:hypothetical protein
MDAWMRKARSAERRELGEGNWNQKKGKKMTADRGRRTAKYETAHRRNGEKKNQDTRIKKKIDL